MSEVYEEEWGNLTALSGYKTIASADTLAHVLRLWEG